MDHFNREILISCHAFVLVPTISFVSALEFWIRYFFCCVTDLINDFLFYVLLVLICFFFPSFNMVQPKVWWLMGVLGGCVYVGVFVGVYWSDECVMWCGVLHNVTEWMCWCVLRHWLLVSLLVVWSLSHYGWYWLVDDPWTWKLQNLRKVTKTKLVVWYVLLQVMWNKKNPPPRNIAPSVCFK